MHTKGPWYSKEQNGELFVASGVPQAGTIIAGRINSDSMFKPDGSTPTIDSEARANANLIAAAPELLEALTEVARVCRLLPIPLFKDELTKQIRQAINKATRKG